jgi:hypothetical protein
MDVNYSLIIKLITQIKAKNKANLLSLYLILIIDIQTFNMHELNTPNSPTQMLSDVVRKQPSFIHVQTCQYATWPGLACYTMMC